MELLKKVDIRGIMTYRNFIFRNCGIEFVCRSNIHVLSLHTNCTCLKYLNKVCSKGNIDKIISSLKMLNLCKIRVIA